MLKSFSAEVEGVSFDFNTMNIQRPQLFQVYVDHDGQKVRFHMQINNEGVFRIALKEACPEPYRHLESLLSATILQHAQEAEQA
ncbi:hypothetical protein KHS38_02595 [Mucilaginibacter sp. Bleaf8]|uniref:hypothetical protein n=1 Tax=Mucilaginibacter sp. Bleaf8 TaxID=2834430 RepID=UPI001BCD5FF3|nr:hypothetical protein [Mucilaginibacter sp. Bleaf8]MBS7563283.1 hypothetical protein [Mucilaginibacter sp. Bleaf8]